MATADCHDLPTARRHVGTTRGSFETMPVGSGEVLLEGRSIVARWMAVAEAAKFTPALSRSSVPHLPPLQDSRSPPRTEFGQRRSSTGQFGWSRPWVKAGNVLVYLEALQEATRHRATMDAR
jgi:hypothetical protein